MKKQIRLLLSFALVAPASLLATKCCDCDTVGHTFYTVRPNFQSASAEKLTMFRDRMDTRKDGRGGALQLVPFVSRSTKTEDLRHYFYPTCKRKLTVKEQGAYIYIDTAAANESGEAFDDTIDIIGQHFRILTKNGMIKLRGAAGIGIDGTDLSDAILSTSEVFESTICMSPRQTVFGVGLTWKHNLNTLFDKEDSDYTWWFEVSSPLVRVKNDLNFVEDKIEKGGGVYDSAISGLDEDYEFFGNMTDAFQQKAWNYGKIPSKCCDKTKTRLADIELKLGTQWVHEDACKLEGYFGVLIPTGNKVKACYMFEPIVGHNRHFGIIKGGSACFRVWDDFDEGKSVHFTTDFHGMYLFEKCEKRSFDLKGKPWSRYMEVYADKAQATQASTLWATDSTRHAAILLATPGINVFTRDLQVKPRISFNCTSAIVFKDEDRSFEGEVGYNFYCRQKECVRLDCKWDPEVAFKGRFGQGQTSPLGTINDPGNRFIVDTTATNFALKSVQIFRELNSYDESIIKEADLDLESAAHPAIFSHTFHVSAGKTWDERDYPLLLSAVASYEFGCCNAAISRFMIGIKGGISF